MAAVFHEPILTIRPAARPEMTNPDVKSLEPALRLVTIALSRQEFLGIRSFPDPGDSKHDEADASGRLAA
jgi:hypothetical protein